MIIQSKVCLKVALKSGVSLRRYIFSVAKFTSQIISIAMVTKLDEHFYHLDVKTALIVENLYGKSKKTDNGAIQRASGSKE